MANSEPPETAPRDLRWSVNVFGKVLVTLGVLTLAFVAYLLWGTGVETRRAQSSLRSDFDELIADRPAAPDRWHTTAVHRAAPRPPRQVRNPVRR